MRNQQVSSSLSPRRSTDRSFGLVFAGFFAIVFGWRAWHGHMSFGWLVPSAFFFAAALVAPRLLRPLNKLWASLGMLLHTVTSPMILGIIYFFVIVPFGLAMRLGGKRPLALARDPAARTYWIERKPSDSASDSFLNQF
jgi:hypothetical protein